jgi:hypothetical protein
MTTQIQRRRGTTAQHSTFTGAVGEVTVDTDKEVLVVHDGAQAGGYPQMRENGSNSALALGSAATPSLKFTGDTNTGIYSPGADQVAISTNGTGRLFVDASGNVGVGVSDMISYDAGSDDFVVGRSGNAGITIKAGTSSFSRLQFADGTGASTYRGFVTYSHADDDMRFGTGGNERLRLTSDGKLGLGTSSPATLFHIKAGSNVTTDLPITIQNNADSLRFGIGAYGLSNKVGASQDTDFYYNVGRDHLFQTDGTTRVVIKEGGAVGIGTTSPAALLDVKVASDAKLLVQDGNTTGNVKFNATNNAVSANVNLEISASNTQFFNGGSERARIDSSGRLLVGTSTSRASYGGNLQIEATTSAATIAVTRNSANTSPAYLFLGKSRSTSVGGNTIVASGDQLGDISFTGSDGSLPVIAASIRAEVDGTPGANDMPGRLVFSTTSDSASSPTERLRIDSTGLVLIGATSLPGVGTSTTGTGFGTSGSISVHRAAATPCYFGRSDDGEVIALYSGTTQRGIVSISGATTTYGSVSDYRLKENIAPISEAASKVSQLKPSKFNFIEFPEQTVDGFIAHEVQEVVPEAVIGSKDAIDEDGKPIYQSIDQSKLVPLLTAALQEALAEIASLKARVTALEP